MTITSVLAAESNMAALGASVLLLGGWIVGSIVMYRSGMKRKRAQEAEAVNGPAQPEEPSASSEPQSSQDD